MSKDTKKVLIPKSLYKKIEEALEGSDAGSVEEYIAQAVESRLGGGPDLSEEEEEKVKERLKALGYMD